MEEIDQAKDQGKYTKKDRGIKWDKKQNQEQLTLFRMGGGLKRPRHPPPSSFSPVTSTNVGISSKNFLTFSFNPFDILV